MPLTLVPDDHVEPVRSRRLALEDAYALSRQLMAAIAAAAHDDADRCRAQHLGAIHAAAVDVQRALAVLVR